MSMRGAARIAGGIALVAVLSVVVIVAWSMLNQSDPAPSAPLAEGPALGDLTGYVGRVDRKARTVEVSENSAGLRPVTMAVTDDTSISVRGKQGGLGDLTKDLPVRAFYEVRNDVKYVTSIQVIADDARGKVASPPAVVSAPPPTRPPASAAPEMSAPSTPASASPAARSVPPRMADPVPASFETATPAASAPPRAAEAVSPPSPTTLAARPADTPAGDGSAVIDWLLRESRRR